MEDGGEALAATAAALPFGPGLAWISMVLVRPDARRRGLATGFMRWALEALHGTACVALDATPAGREVYRRLGFRDLWGFRRWTLPLALPAVPGIAIRPLRDADWPAVLALDLAGFGAPREFLLRDFAARLPAAALVAEGPDGAPCGFGLARDGLRAAQIGPVLAPDGATARALLAAARAALPAGLPAVLDLCDARAEIAAWIAAQGGEAQRPFTRMALGADAPGDPRALAAVAGPEFG
jgi:hypothetical protein